MVRVVSDKVGRKERIIEDRVCRVYFFEFLGLRKWWVYKNFEVCNHFLIVQEKCGFREIKSFRVADNEKRVEEEEKDEEKRMWWWNSHFFLIVWR